MRRIPKALLEDILSDPYYTKCARYSSACAGRITLEHAIIVAGRQLDRKWSIIPLCERHHAVGQFMDSSGLLDKRENQRIAVARATPEELAEYPRVNWAQYARKG